MRVVGVDQSYTGFGHSVDGISRKKTFPASKYSGDIQRLIAVEEWFAGWLVEVYQDGGDVDLVVMEGYANQAQHGREKSGELGWAVKRTIFVTLGLEPLIVPPNSLKKFVTGSGAAKKNTMIAHVYKKWGQMFSDDNQADAFALEMFGLAYLDIQHGVGGYHKYETEAIDAVRHPRTKK